MRLDARTAGDRGAYRGTVLDVTCAGLAGALTERYLAIKRDGLL